MMDQISCAATIGQVIAGCYNLFDEDCDIDNPDSCDALWKCAQEKAGDCATYEKCCGCMESNLGFMNKDIDLPCCSCIEK